MPDFKRNIFASSAKEPKSYEPCATPMTPTDCNGARPTFYPMQDHGVKHAPIPRIGEQS